MRVLQRRPTKSRRCLGTMIATCGCFRQGTIWSSWRSRTAERSIFPDVRWSVQAGYAVARHDAPRLPRLCARCSAWTWMWSQRGGSQRPSEDLRPTALALRGMRPPRFAELFEAFANVVPFQQLSLDAGVAIVGRLVERFGERLRARRPRLPRLSQGPGDRRRTDRGAAGVRPEPWEGRIHPIAREAIESGELSAEKLAGMSTNDALETLVDLPGIGPWSAGLVLLRGLGRLDVFPPGDVGAERGLRTLLRAGARTSLKRIVAAIRRSSRISLLLRARREPPGERPVSTRLPDVLARWRVRSPTISRAMQVANHSAISISR